MMIKEELGKGYEKYVKDVKDIKNIIYILQIIIKISKNQFGKEDF